MGPGCLRSLGETRLLTRRLATRYPCGSRAPPSIRAARARESHRQTTATALGESAGRSGRHPALRALIETFDRSVAKNRAPWHDEWKGGTAPEKWRCEVSLRPPALACGLWERPCATRKLVLPLGAPTRLCRTRGSPVADCLRDRALCTGTHGSEAQRTAKLRAARSFGHVPARPPPPPHTPPATLPAPNPLVMSRT